ncbi:hypothetical protein TNCV_4427791 [Trichonephila clavipes]|nr:hypothetical protein TNCV_4427791 [Trichonephila clavipes]
MEITKEQLHGGFGASELTQTRCGFTESEPSLFMYPSPSSVSWGKLPTRTSQPTFRIRILTSTFAGLKEDTRTNDSLAADQR